MMKKPIKILITIPYGKENMRRVESLGYEVTFIEESVIGKEPIPCNFEILICWDPFKKIDIKNFDRLKWIQLVSKGINQVPKTVIDNNNIIVTNNGDATAVPISEWIVAMLLFIYKNSSDIHERKNKRQWFADKGVLEVSGSVIGFLGTGNIAKNAAIRLKPFGTEIIGVNRTGRTVENFDECYAINCLEDFIRKCDVVISTLPETADTRHLLNGKVFSLMKKDTTIINVSRGAVIDEAALIRYLEKDIFRGVALDVFDKEPLPASSPLWGFENVIVTPHNSYLSDKYRDRVFNEIFNNLKRYKEHIQLKNIIDFDKGY